mmetsp:Transcript_25703/g.41444  ORF Transcript_25703/g.41444 Transcript_25703/m.41444 type:complete len:542 (-) Transcript_25703:1319-2944(-)
MDATHAIILICLCLLTFGSYFSYDLPGALTDDFRDTLAEGNAANQGLFYSLYSLPNTVQPFFGGILIDRVLGLRRGVVICCSLIACGNMIVAVAATNSAWSGTSTAFIMALSGRFLFGMGGELCSVCQNAFTAKWFSGSDLTLAFAIVLSCARIGSSVMFAIEPKISVAYGFPSALWLSVICCFMSLCACFCLIVMDKRYESTIDASPAVETTDSNETALLSDDVEGELRRSHSLDNVPDAEDNEAINDRNLQAEDAAQNEVAVKESLSFMDTLFSVLGIREGLIYLICVQFYVAVFVFIAVASKLLVDLYPESVDKVKAGLLVSLPYTVSAIVSPFLGYTMDKVGYHLVFVGIACMSLLGIHCTFAFIPHKVEPTAIMVWLGLTYSMCAASLWPMIALVTESRNLSTAYGLMMSIQNIGLAIAPAFIMKMIPTQKDKEHLTAYKTIELIFASLAFGAFICTVFLYFADEQKELCSAPLADEILTGQPSPRVNPLNPRATPYLRGRGAFRPSREVRRAIAPKTPQAIRRQYFRRLRLPTHI